MEYHIRLQYVVGEIGHKSIQSLCREVAQGMGHYDLRTLFNYPRVMSQIHHLRGVKDVCDIDNEKMMNVLTERQWYSLYVKTDRQTGCCCVVAREDVDERLDIPLVYKLMKHVFNACIPEGIFMALGVLRELKEKTDRAIYMEEKDFEDIFGRIRGSLMTISSYVGMDIAQGIESAKQKEIQNLVDDDSKNFLKLRMLLKDPAERIVRSTLNVSMSRAGFKDREEMFENPFVLSELSRKAAIWSNKRGCQRGQRSFMEQIFDFKGHMQSVKQSVKQCLCSFDFDFLYKMMRDISVLSLELTPYTKDGIFSFIKTLREIYGLVMRGCPDNKIRSSEFFKYWKSCEEALKVLLRFTGCSYDEEISSILKMNLNEATFQRSNMGKPVIYRIRLEFPPDGLTKYEYSRTRIAEALRKHGADGKSQYLQLFDEGNHDLIIVHHEHQAATETCEEFFDVEANLTKTDLRETRGSDDKRNPVVCLVDPNVHRMSGRCEYLGVISNTTIAEITNMDFTKTTFPYLLDVKYSSEAEKRPLYISMQEALTMKVSSVIGIIKRQGLSIPLIDSLEKHQRCIREEYKSNFNMTKQFKDWLRSEMSDAIQCFSVSSKVKIYFKEGHEERLRSEIKLRQFAEESDLEFVRVDKSLKFIPLFRPGTHIYLDQSSRHGSIALYGKMRSSSKTVAISHGHVIQEGQTAYVAREGVRKKLGMAIHPPYDQAQSYPGELSVVEVTNEEVKQLLEEARQQHKEVNIYREESANLDKKKVVKFGAGTERTVGFVVEPCLNKHVFGDVCEGILIEEQNKGRFADRGDSGALAYIPGRRQITAISLIFSEFELPDYNNAVLTAKFHDCKTTFERRSNDVIEIESDHGLSVMGNTANQIY